MFSLVLLMPGGSQVKYKSNFLIPNRLHSFNSTFFASFSHYSLLVIVKGHSYIVYGPLLNGISTFMFESTPMYPDHGRYWDMVQRHKITVFYTAPTAIRSLMRFGDEAPNKYDLSSLKVLGTVGEPINPAAWKWYFDVIGKGRCSVVDTYWQVSSCSPFKLCGRTEEYLINVSTSIVHTSCLNIFLPDGNRGSCHHQPPWYYPYEAWIMHSTMLRY